MLYTRYAKAPAPLAEVGEVPERRNRFGMGILTGVVLGAGLWVAILAITRTIKL